MESHARSCSTLNLQRVKMNEAKSLGMAERSSQPYWWHNQGEKAQQARY